MLVPVLPLDSDAVIGDSTHASATIAPSTLWLRDYGEYDEDEGRARIFFFCQGMPANAEVLRLSDTTLGSFVAVGLTVGMLRGKRNRARAYAMCTRQANVYATKKRAQLQLWRQPKKKRGEEATTKQGHLEP